MAARTRLLFVFDQTRIEKEMASEVNQGLGWRSLLGPLNRVSIESLKWL
jgi:hypothetical protein